MNIVFVFISITSAFAASFGDKLIDQALQETPRGRALHKVWARCEQGTYPKAICVKTELLINKLVKLRQNQ